MARLLRRRRAGSRSAVAAAVRSRRALSVQPHGSGLAERRRGFSQRGGLQQRNPDRRRLAKSLGPASGDHQTQDRRAAPDNPRRVHQSRRFADEVRQVASHQRDPELATDSDWPALAGPGGVQRLRQDLSTGAADQTGSAPSRTTTVGRHSDRARWPQPHLPAALHLAHRAVPAGRKRGDFFASGLYPVLD